MIFPASPGRRAALLLSLVLMLAACATPTAPPPPPARPRLLVLFVVDGLPVRQVTGLRDQFGPDGFARFLDGGADFTQAHYGYAFTVTCAGHATLLTGAYPHRSGIIGNEWVDLASGKPTYCAADPAEHYIGQPTEPLDGTSPRKLMAESVGDVLRRVDPRSKVIAISGKDRGAIMPAGHAGTAYMYMGGSGRFVSSSYYMQRHPDWVEAFNAARHADRWFHTQWQPLLPEAAYARSVPDRQPWFGPKGGELPMMLGAAGDSAPGPDYYAALLASPFADTLTLDFARAAIVGEGLGTDDVPDILAISLSGHDYVNHRWSAESRMSQDHLLRLDRLLQDFFADLDRTVGRDHYVAVLTADHGFTPAPELSRERGLDAGRINGSQLLAAVNGALAQRFGAPRLVTTASASALVLDRAQIAARALDFDAVADAARTALLAQPGIASAYTRRELASGSRAGAPLFDMMRNTWHPEVSGDVQYVQKPKWMFGTTAATHGSPYEDDTHVPLLLWGPAWVRPGQREAPVQMSDLAPTVAALLGVATPSLSEGKPLPISPP
ncbi:alkaline phosphatase family protein [Ramlibacter sp.]|uniref:alkaline phosphatase family protein n=1 Tax=Ramlibacter sp. TaxID=1917967 RepID=UPI002622DD1D|nr:alkaline phosphatase family protein [Ramlibacter sp.]MDB5956621.1 alkaline phosphatase family protein [Ramlibacter sp.]